MTETVIKTEDGAIVYDSAVVNQIRPESFSPQGWAHAEPVSGHLRSAGRGNTHFVGNIPRQFVLRHFVRGGLGGHLVRDRYLFVSEDQTRAFLEWRLLAKLASNGLRVPRPAAMTMARLGPLMRRPGAARAAPASARAGFRPETSADRPARGAKGPPEGAPRPGGSGPRSRSCRRAGANGRRCR